MSELGPPNPPAEASPPLDITASRLFTGWLAARQVSLAFTTYQAGKVFFVGRKEGDRLGLFERTFPRCMGLCATADGQTLWLSSAYQLWRLENVLVPGTLTDGYDRLYVPRVGYTTGNVDVHDVTVDENGRVVFVNTLFNCLATTSERYSFEPIWKPPFITKLCPEDRCHLNGLALYQGKPRYVTVCSKSDILDGWREKRRDGGAVIDVESGEIVVAGLSMPHSPRVHDGKLWLLEAGSGYLGYVDMGRGTFERVTFCPGYARGLAMLGNHALVGISKCRRERTFSGLELDENLARHDVEARCGLLVVDLDTGDIVQWLRLEGRLEELYDVIALPGTARPKALGFKTDEIQNDVRLDVDGRPLHWTALPKDSK